MRRDLGGRPSVRTLASARASRSATPSPTPRPRAEPKPASTVSFDRRGEPPLVGDLVGALLAHAEELGDLDESYPR
jgi:hypothetical protein